MLQAFSRFEQVIRETLIRKAPDEETLDRLAEFYGFRRPTRFTASAWRKALRATAFGPRGTLGHLMDTLEGAFSEDEIKFQVTLDAANPRTLTYASGDEANFTDCHIGRLARVTWLPEDKVDQLAFVAREDLEVSAIFQVVGPYILPGGTSTTLELAPVTTSYWQGANFGALDQRFDPAYNEASLDLLAFFFEEPGQGFLEDKDGPTTLAPYGEPCTVNLYADLEERTAPPTYLLDPPGVDRDSIDPLMPDGGIIMDPLNLAGDDPPPPQDGNQVTGPFPIYLNQAVTSGLEEVLDLQLAAGIRLREIVWSFCTPP